MNNKIILLVKNSRQGKNIKGGRLHQGVWRKTHGINSHVCLPFTPNPNTTHVYHKKFGEREKRGKEEKNKEKKEKKRKETWKIKSQNQKKPLEFHQAQGEVRKLVLCICICCMYKYRIFFEFSLDASRRLRVEFGGLLESLLL